MIYSNLNQYMKFSCNENAAEYVDQFLSFPLCIVLKQTVWFQVALISPSLSWTSYQIHKIAGCACAGNAGNVFPRRRFQRKLLVSDPGMHHGTCVTHVPWCMSGSLTCSDGENVPGIPGACAPAILRIWQEANSWKSVLSQYRLGHYLAYYH